jgi:putative transposase
MISLYDDSGRGQGGETMVSFKGAHFPQDIILMGVRWYVAYPLSYRHVEELMEERGVPIDHATIQRWVVKYSPQLEAAFHRRKRPVWVSWRMDETYIKVKGQWYDLYRAGDKAGQTIDFLLTEQLSIPVEIWLIRAFDDEEAGGL